MLFSFVILPFSIRLAILIFAAGLFLAYYQERITAGDATFTAVLKTAIASPYAIFKFVVGLFTKTSTTTTAATTTTEEKKTA